MYKHGSLKLALKALTQMAVMAAIVATLFYVPAALAVALLFAVLGVSIDPVVTFGGFFNLLIGMCVWWLLAFAAACAYTACAFPWEDEVLAWPRKK